MTAKPRRRKSYPLALLNNKVNLDQLLAINNAMRYPLAYVQARWHRQDQHHRQHADDGVFQRAHGAFSSYNNHPIDGVVEKLQAVTYHGQTVPFPILRLGNNEKTAGPCAPSTSCLSSAKKSPCRSGCWTKTTRTARPAPNS